jgi:hypothetical protein
MAKIESLTFSITRTSYPDVSICSVEYSYYLHIDAKQYVHDDSFSICVELHGDDILHDKRIGESSYDSHVVNKLDEMPQTRSFSVPCEVLDEAWGEDRVYLKIYVQSSGGEVITQKTATIREWF